MTRPILIRAYEPQDHEVVASLYAVAKPLGMTVPEADAGTACRLVAESEAGQVVGYGAVSGEEPSNLVLVVAPDRQRQGLGSQLWECLRRELATRGTTALEPWVRQENMAGVAWLQKQGFQQINPDGPVQLLLAEANMTPFEAAWETVAAQGVTLTTLAEEKARDPECLVKLHTLYTTVEADVPGNDPAAAPSSKEFANEWGKPDKLLFLAKDGEQYIGLSTAAPRSADSYFEERHDIFQQHLTGVLPAYRRRGLAAALKGLVVAHARREGYRTLWTNSGNPAMRALNWKLGFRTGPWLVYHKTLVKESLHV